MTKERKDDAASIGEEIGEHEPKDLNGLDPDRSLLSVNFATTENPYFSEHRNLDSKGQSEP
ncbi:hypothetical protein [Bacillus canaveralius]|uniref:hypothetical protein n=1 Tax=Bacillus canaveralius TaxID=1403243 RepID=UPI000F7A65EC|nr:hypothetical protein [Bacillus canaveralius]RSK47900.1 hypothetical protein EJA13_17630 [Bacillus canaveralius]